MGKYIQPRAIVFACLALLAVSARAEDAAQFYAHNQITLIVGTSAGGGYDLYSRILADFLPRKILGRPSIVVQNMPNASGVGATNYVYNLAPKDGTVLAMCTAGIVMTEALSPAQVKYRSARLGWVGTVSTMTDVLAVMKSTGVATIDDARHTRVLLGANGKTSTLSLQPKLVNALLGTKFEIISGYAGGNEVNLAMERGEVLGRTNQWDSWISQRPQWISGHQLNTLLQFGPKVPDLPDTPVFRDLVRDPDKAAIVDLLEVIQYVGRSVFTSPGVPEDRMRVLRDAFVETMKDPEFLARLQAAKLDVNWQTGQQTQAYVEKVMNGVEGPARAFNQIIDAN